MKNYKERDLWGVHASDNFCSLVYGRQYGQRLPGNYTLRRLCRIRRAVVGGTGNALYTSMMVSDLVTLRVEFVETYLILRKLQEIP